MIDAIAQHSSSAVSASWSKLLVLCHIATEASPHALHSHQLLLSRFFEYYNNDIVIK